MPAARLAKMLQYDNITHIPHNTGRFDLTRLGNIQSYFFVHVSYCFKKPFISCACKFCIWQFAFGSYEFHSEMRFKTAIKLCGENKTKIELNSPNHNYVISKE